MECFIRPRSLGLDKAYQYTIGLNITGSDGFVDLIVSVELLRSLGFGSFHRHCSKVALITLTTARVQSTEDNADVFDVTETPVYLKKHQS